jgi:lysozyme
VKASDKCISLIKACESLKLTAYLCPAGLATIGYGHTRGVTNADVKNGKVITREQADALLAEDLDEFEQSVEDAIHVPLTQGQFDALVSFAYNCKGWRSSTLVQLVNQRKYAEAANEFDRWVFGGGKKLNGLVYRRSLEKKLFLSA